MQKCPHAYCNDDGHDEEADKDEISDEDTDDDVSPSAVVEGFDLPPHDTQH